MVVKGVLGLGACVSLVGGVPPPPLDSRPRVGARGQALRGNDEWATPTNPVSGYGACLGQALGLGDKVGWAVIGVMLDRNPIMIW